MLGGRDNNGVINITRKRGKRLDCVGACVVWSEFWDFWRGEGVGRKAGSSGGRDNAGSRGDLQANASQVYNEWLTKAGGRAVGPGEVAYGRGWA